ncbi:MAG TPA: V-type proton ATPase subunit E [Methanothermobacter sp.]|nr:V-type proton ATPase subunit E [Methanothermobacter sp. MT-2]HHW05369.1 V-type ATP synthase subunit E [Methanothermobacter sp.]HOK73124.1 V-type proton ATPase subunit E [Methanothermobacter sp.]HOL68756.1 V-type proton ATPase subunit E [Methanothermobacter sp.]HPQ04649.1 V-type proton ATPase subunit E [Methanothermobacter sp.]
MDPGVDKIVSSIISEAQENANKIISEAEKKAEAIIEDGEKRAAIEREKIIENAKKQAQMQYHQLISEAKMKARRAELEAREEIITEAFKKAEEELQRMSSSKDEQYIQSLKNIIKEAATEIGGGELLVHVKEDDKEKIKDLDSIAEDVKSATGKDTSLEFGESIQTIGGAIVKTKDGRIEVNNTIEARLSRFEKLLRSEVAKILFD